MTRIKPAHPSLALLIDGVVAKEFPLDKPEITIGRRSNNDIRIDDIAVSGRHARILVRPNRYLEGTADVFIEDLDSTNGTKVNGTPIRHRRLAPGDLIQIGWNSFKLLDPTQTDLERTAYILQE